MRSQARSHQRSTENISVALLISGSGSTAEAVIRACQSGKIKKIIPRVVISSNTEALGIAKAQALRIPCVVINPRNYTSSEKFADALNKALAKYGVDFVSQNGWLPRMHPKVIAQFKDRYVNQHLGALDPDRRISPSESADFGGRGMYGPRMTTATLAYTWLTRSAHPKTEATVHLVTPTQTYDDGNLIITTPIPLPLLKKRVDASYLLQHPRYLMIQTWHIQAKALPIEHKTIIKMLQLVADKGFVPSFRREKPLIPKENYQALLDAKKLAVELHKRGYHEIT